MGNKHNSILGHKDLPALAFRDQFALSFLWFALNIQSAALLPIVIPTQILLFVSPGAVGNAQQAIFLGWLSALGAVAALALQPVIGALSDRTTGAFGRRRPYILAGGVLLVFGTIALGLAPDIAAFVGAFVVVNIGLNVATAAYQSMLPDRVPPEQRGTASGYLGVMTIIGNVGSLAIAALLLGSVGEGVAQNDYIRSGSLAFYALAGGVLVVGLAVTLFAVPDTPLQLSTVIVGSGDRRVGGRLRLWLFDLWIEPWRHGTFAWVFWTRGFVMMGLTLFMTFIEYYFNNVSHVTNFVRATAIVATLALVGAVASALVVGMLSDRASRVIVVCIATAFMALAAAIFVVAPVAFPLWPLGIVFGLGYGAYTSVDWALAVDALPALGAAGKDMGLWNIASTLPAVLAPLVGGIVIVATSQIAPIALGYRLVFALAAIFMVAGAVFVLKIREEMPEEQPDVAHHLSAR